MQNNIKCPNCGHQFDVESALAGEIDARYRKEYESKVNQHISAYKKEQEAREKTLQDQVLQLNEQKELFEERRKRSNELFKEKLDKAKGQLLVEVKTQVAEENAAKMQTLEKQLADKKNEVKNLQLRELELLQKEQALKDQQENMEIDLQKKLFEEREKIVLETKSKEAERHRLRELEFEKQLNDQKKLIEEMKRKAEQGSMQLQGEILELAIEQMLNAKYPQDVIEEVSKGISGADVIQSVVNSAQQVCGKIIYETKRTKTFSEGWIEKLRQDQRNEKASLAVLVTQAMPKDMDNFGLRNGVWVCSFKEVGQLSFVLRELLIREFSAKSSLENKSDKMELLYHYLTGDEFKQRVEAIVEGFTSLQNDINQEKRAMAKIWKQREKQIEKVMMNTIDMYGAVKGIAGASVANIKALELPDDQLDLDLSI